MTKLKKVGRRAASRTKAKTKKKVGGDYISLNGEKWPVERDVFFRPDRLKYVRKLIQTEGCVFCRAAKEEPSFDTLCVHQSEHSMIVLNKYPYNSGHLLVLPRRHIGDLLELKKDEYADLHEVVRLAVEALTEVYKPNGLNLGLNLGAVSGAGLPDHIHYHIIPRWAGDLNFFPLVAETKTVVESLETTFERLVTYFKN